jgi:hypothetical protein
LFGRLPSNYGIEIVNRETYRSLAAKRHSKFNENFLMRMAANDMLVKSYNELNGRTSNQIIAETENKFKKMVLLLND